MEGEVTTLADCLEIERNDGVFIRLTNHDRSLFVNGVKYLTGATFNTSAIKSSADLSVDNLQLDLGIDGSLTKKVDFDSDLYKRAKFTLFVTNWADTSQGIAILAKGWLGDTTIHSASYVTLQLRGLTQALQQNFLSYYSPTCRASFGDLKCGVSTTPFRLHQQNREYKVGDRVLVPVGTVPIPLGNASFETQGVVANSNGSVPITGWTHEAGSFWRVNNTLTGIDGSYYLQGGDDSGASPSGTVFGLSRFVSATGAGMPAGSIDAGEFIAGVSAFVTTPSLAKADSARLKMTLYDNMANILKVINSDYFTPTYGEWTEITVSSFIVPKTRQIKITLEGVKTDGDLEVAFDNVALKYWSASSSYLAAYKAVRIPSYAPTDRRLPVNYRFVNDGEVSNGDSGIGGWEYGTGAYWRTAPVFGGLSPVDGAYFLRGGNDGSGLGDREYDLISSEIDVSDLNAALLANGNYICELRLNAANIADMGSYYSASIEFYDSSGSLLDTEFFDYMQAPLLEEWEPLSLSAKLPANTDYLQIILSAKSSSSNSVANVAFDAVQVYILSTVQVNTHDATLGRSADVRPTFNPTLGELTYDGQIIWEAQALSFDFDTVQNATDRRVFNALTMTGGEYDYYGAKIFWLTGENAGTESYVRTWSPGTKELRLYAPTANAIAGGDLFMFSLGCNKSIEDCQTRFNNAINFRGEPYLPGPQKVLETFTPGAT